MVQTTTCQAACIAAQEFEMDVRKKRELNLRDIDWIEKNPTEAARLIEKMRADIESILCGLERSLAVGDPSATVDAIVYNQRNHYEVFRR